MPEPKRGPTAGPPGRIIENKPAPTVAQALANAKAQVDAASKS